MHLVTGTAFRVEFPLLLLPFPDFRGKEFQIPDFFFFLLPRAEHGKAGL